MYKAGKPCQLVGLQGHGHDGAVTSRGGPGNVAPGTRLLQPLLALPGWVQAVWFRTQVSGHGYHAEQIALEGSAVQRFKAPLCELRQVAAYPKHLTVCLFAGMVTQAMQHSTAWCYHPAPLCLVRLLCGTACLAPLSGSCARVAGLETPGQDLEVCGGQEGCEAGRPQSSYEGIIWELK